MGKKNATKSIETISDNKVDREQSTIGLYEMLAQAQPLSIKRDDALIDLTGESSSVEQRRDE